MAELFDREIGKWVEVPENADLNKHVASGRYGFESGVDIPVVTPDGQLTSIKTDDAEKLFQEGYRWQTAQDREINTQNKLRESQAEIYNDPLLAGANSAVNAATLGASNSVLGAMGLGQGAELLKQENSTADVVGGLAPLAVGLGGAAAGAMGLGRTATALNSASEILNPLGGVISRIASPLGTAVAPAGKAIANLVPGSGKVAQTAATILENAPSNIAKGAGEGIIYGLGHGIGEAAIDPEQNFAKTAEHLYAGGKMGALFGGILGGAFGAGSDSIPLLKDITKATAEKSSDIADSVINSVAGSALKRRLAKMGDETAVADVDLLLNDKTALNKINKLGEKPFQELDRQAAKAEADLNKHLEAQQSQLDDYLAKVPEKQKAWIGEQLAQAKGDAAEASQAMYARQREADSRFIDDLHAQNAPSESVGDLYNTTLERIGQMRLSKDPMAKALANRLENILDGELSAAGINHDIKDIGMEGRRQFLNERMGLPKEVELAQRLRSEIPEDFAKFKARRDHDIISALGDDIDRISLAGKKTPEGYEGGNANEAARKGLQELAEHHDAVTQFAEAIGKSVKGNDANAIFMRLAKGADPRLAGRIEGLSSKLDQLYPEIQACIESIGKLAEQENAVQAFTNKYNQLRDSSESGRMTLQDAEKMLSMVAGNKGKFDTSIDAIKKMQATIATTEGMTPATKLITIKHTLGQPVSGEMQQLVQLEPAYQAAERLKNIQFEKSRLQKILPYAGAVGGLVSHGPVGAIAGFKSGEVLAERLPFGGRSAFKSLQTIGILQRAAENTTKQINATIDAVVEGLAKPNIARASIPAAMSMTEQRKQFPEQQKILTQMANPADAAEYMQNRMSGFPGAPQTQAAVVAQALKTAQFLQQKIPTDPLAGQDPFKYTPYIPSDRDLSKFNRYVNAAQNPQAVMKHITQGIVTPEEIETLQVLYPNIYQKLQNGIMDDITRRRVEPSYQQKIVLGTTFNLPTDPTLQPAMIASLQANLHSASQPAPSGRPEGKSIKIDLDPMNRLATETTRITNK